MVTLTSNKRCRFHRRVGSVQRALELAYSFEQLVGEVWTVSQGGMSVQVDPMRDPLGRMLRVVPMVFDVPQGASVATMRELSQGPVYADALGDQFVSVTRLGAWVALGLSAFGMIGYALAYL